MTETWFYWVFTHIHKNWFNVCWLNFYLLWDYIFYTILVVPNLFLTCYLHFDNTNFWQCPLFLWSYDICYTDVALNLFHSFPVHREGLGLRLWRWCLSAASAGKTVNSARLTKTGSTARPKPDTREFIKVIPANLHSSWQSSSSRRHSSVVSGGLRTNGWCLWAPTKGKSGLLSDHSRPKNQSRHSLRFVKCSHAFKWPHLLWKQIL